MPSKELKITNIRTLFRLSRTQGRVSQAYLSQNSGLQTSTVSNLTREMREAGLLVSDGKGISGPDGGRRSDLLSVNADFAVFGVHLVRPREVVSCLLDLHGRIMSRTTQPLPPEAHPRLGQILLDTSQQWATAFPKLGAVSVIPFGTLHPEGDLQPCNDFPWGMTAFVESMKNGLKPLQKDVLVETAANAAAWYSRQLVGRSVSCLINYHITREPYSLLAGIILNGEPFRGPQGTAGSIWGGGEHTPYPFNGSSHSVEQLLRRIAEFILSGASFLDADLVTINGDFLQLDISLVEPFAELLRMKASPCKVELIRERDAAIIGAAFLAADHWLERKLHEDP